MVEHSGDVFCHQGVDRRRGQADLGLACSRALVAASELRNCCSMGIELGTSSALAARPWSAIRRLSSIVALAGSIGKGQRGYRSKRRRRGENIQQPATRPNRDHRQDLKC